ncbi:MAG: nitrite reductase large subunit NirB [Actinobacteria bacterium]|nr:nitrite reductase large subunit NirB [Actinomycetota bacterium]
MAPHTSSHDRLRLVVVGNGMVGQHLLAALVDAGAAPDLDITVLGEEHRPAYDRVALSSLFDGRTAEDLSLVQPGFFEEHGITCRLGDPVTTIDRESRKVHTASGLVFAYDELVLATGSAPFVPPIEGGDAPGCHVYRTIDDLRGIEADAADPAVRTGVVVGGGLLGLEAANALRNLGLDTHVVEFAPRLMPVQLDEAGGAALRRHVEDLGVHVHTGRATTAIESADGRPVRLTFDGHEPLEAQIVVFSAGIRPRDAIAREAGLEVGPRGGVLVDGSLRSSDPTVSAIGECAAVEGRCHGLVAPGYRMARAVAARIAARATNAVAGPDQRFEEADPSTKLKLLGVDVATIGDIHAEPAEGERRHALVWEDPLRGVYQRVDVDDHGRVVAAVLVGDAQPWGELLARFRRAEPVEDPGALLRPPADPASGGGATIERSTPVCSCENVSAGALLDAISEGCGSVADLKGATRAGTGCGGCVPIIEQVVRFSEGAPAGAAPPLCAHFAHTRAELFEIVRVTGLATFTEIIEAHGVPGAAERQGAGCEVCKPTVASILSSLGGGHILDGEQGALQDTNDHFLANLQKDGTYSVVPRIPGGEITAEKLIVIGEVARDFGLYTKITGGQRIDLFGARVEQLPLIWTRLVDAGFESGHAYGKSLRTVKSCVGETWCRYGVADSTSMAILLEERYRGLRSPHKLKLAVSGCARECAEAQSKDVGVIATEKGWNLWVGGNGGMRPRHAELLAEDLDDETLVRYIDRFLMYYVRSADRLRRTASWIDGLDGGIDAVRRVVVDDALGLADQLEEMMASHVASYRCEWRETIEDPDRLARFVTYVNAPDTPDPRVQFVQERGQIRPARADEREQPVTIGGVR